MFQRRQRADMRKKAQSKRKKVNAPSGFHPFGDILNQRRKWKRVSLCVILSERVCGTPRPNDGPPGTVGANKRSYTDRVRRWIYGGSGTDRILEIEKVWDFCFRNL